MVTGGSTTTTTKNEYMFKQFDSQKKTYYYWYSIKPWFTGNAMKASKKQGERVILNVEIFEAY